MPKRKKSASRDLCSPIATYVVGPHGLRLHPSMSEKDGWNDLRDVGRRLSLPPQKGEILSEYAARLHAHLEPFERHIYIDGAAVFALRLTCGLYMNPIKRQ